MSTKERGKSKKSEAIEGSTPEVLPPPLSPEQEQAAHVLAYCGFSKGRRTRAGSVRLAAKQVGVTRQAVYKWLKLPEFVEEIESQKAKGFYAAWQGLMVGAAAGNASSCEAILNRLQQKRDPRIVQMKLKHKQIMIQKKLEHKLRLIEIEKRAELGLPVNDEPITYNVVVTEAPMPDEPEGLH